MTTEVDGILRLLAATAVGMAIGANRDLAGKPIGVRTLALVSMGAAALTVVAIGFDDIALHPDAVSRVLQGIIQGTLTGISFIGAGVILRNPQENAVHGLTTAATVRVTAALGIVCALAAWTTVAVGTVLTIAILYVVRRVDAHISSHEE